MACSCSELVCMAVPSSWPLRHAPPRHKTAIAILAGNLFIQDEHERGRSHPHFYLGWGGPSWPSGSGGGRGVGDLPPAGEAVSTSSPGRRSEGALGGRTSGSEELLATVSGRSTSRSVWMIFSPSTYMLSRRTTSSPTRRTKSTSCGGSP